MLPESLQVAIVSELNRDLEQFFLCYKRHANEINAIIQAVIRSHDHIEPLARAKEPLLSFKRMIFPYKQLEDKYHHQFPIYTAIKSMLRYRYVELNRDINEELWDLCFEAVMSGNIHFVYGEMTEVERGEIHHDVYLYLSASPHVFEAVYFYSQVLLENLLLNPYETIPRRIDCHLIDEKDIPAKNVVFIRSNKQQKLFRRQAFLHILQKAAEDFYRIKLKDLRLNDGPVQFVGYYLQALVRFFFRKPALAQVYYEKYLEPIILRAEERAGNFDAAVINELYQMILVQQTSINFLHASHSGRQYEIKYVQQVVKIINGLASQFRLQMLEVGLESPPSDKILVIEYPESDNDAVNDYVRLHPNMPADSIPTEPEQDVLVGESPYWEQQRDNCLAAIELLKKQAYVLYQQQMVNADIVFGHYFDGMLINEKIEFLYFIHDRLAGLYRRAITQEQELLHKNLEKVHAYVTYYNDLLASLHHLFFEEKNYWLSVESFDSVLRLARSQEQEMVGQKQNDKTITYYRYIIQMINDVTRLKQFAAKLWEDELNNRGSEDPTLLKNHKKYSTHISSAGLFSGVRPSVKVYLTLLPGCSFGRDVSLYALSPLLVGGHSYWLAQIQFCDSAINSLLDYANRNYSVYATFIDGIRIKEKIEYLVHIREKLILIGDKARVQDRLLQEDSSESKQFCIKLQLAYEAQLAESCKNPYLYQGTTFHWEIISRQCNMAIEKFKQQNNPGEISEKFQQLRAIRGVIIELKTESETKLIKRESDDRLEKSIWFKDISDIDFIAWYRQSLAYPSLDQAIAHKRAT